MKKYIVSVLVGASIMAPVFAFADHTTAHAIEQLQVKVQDLQAQLRGLQSSQAGSGASGVSSQSSVAGGGSGGQTGMGGGVSVLPQPIPPMFDDDTSDDDIVQLNNLRIQTVSGKTLPVVIGAAYDFGVRCRKFSGREAAQSVEFPCPAAPTILYQIRVDEDTRLFLRNRQKASVADFAVGDRINVYGFMDRDTRTIDALILRNIDKPFQETPIQLNDVSVLEIKPAEAGKPALLTVIQRGVIRCFEFQGSASGVAFPCPFGVEQKQVDKAAGEAGGGASSAAALAFPAPRKYLVDVSEKIKILNRNREPMPFTDIVAGDILNIYGFQTKEAGRIRAEIIRDLSRPVSKAAGMLRVVVASDSCLYPEALVTKSTESGVTAISPCGGLIYGAVVVVKNSDGKIIAERKTSDGVAVFDNLALGGYLISASATGYIEASQKIVLDRPGEVKTLRLILSKKGANAVSISTSSNLSGFVGKKFEATFFAKGGVAPYAWEVARGTLPSGLALSQTVSVQPCAVGESYPPTVICPPQPEQNSVLLHGVPTQGGNFTFVLMAKDAKGNTGESTFVSVISADLEPVAPLKVISPNGGEQWEKGTARAIKWTPGRVCPSGAYCIAADETVDIQLTPYVPPCTGTMCPLAPDILYPIATNTRHDGEFEWIVGKTLYGQQVPNGKYVISVVKSGTGISDQSDAPFSIVAQ